MASYVYTGNLVNQGTADFKSGITTTGSIDITGDYLINGVPISAFDTGSFVTTSSFNAYTASVVSPTQFNHAFAVDPINETFLTIIGPRAAYDIKFQLTSGSEAITAGQLQVVYNGANTTGFDSLVQRTISGAPLITGSTIGFGGSIDVRATFIGSDYIISGSYLPMN